MKSIKMLFTLIATIGFVLSLMACPPEIIEPETVSIFPVFIPTTAIPKTIEYDMDAPQWDGPVGYYYLFGPPLMGWENGTFTIGQTYETLIMGDLASTTVSRTTDGSIIYTIIFSDKKGSSTLTLRPDNTFTYTQQLLLALIHNGPDSFGYIKTEMSGTRNDTVLTAIGRAVAYLGTSSACDLLLGYEYEFRSRSNGDWVGLYLKTTGSNDATVTLPAPAYDIPAIESAMASLDINNTGEPNLLLLDAGVWTDGYTQDEIDVLWASHP